MIRIRYWNASLNEKGQIQMTNRADFIRLFTETSDHLKVIFTFIL